MSDNFGLAKAFSYVWVYSNYAALTLQPLKVHANLKKSIFFAH